jgi:hypothetical protein
MITICAWYFIDTVRGVDWIHFVFGVNQKLAEGGVRFHGGSYTMFSENSVGLFSETFHVGDNY